MEEEGSNTRDSVKSARLKRKLILQGKRLRRSQNERAKKAYIFNENIGYVDLGDPSETCAYCQAAMRYQERTRKNRKQANPKYSLCCSMGRIQLPFLKNPAMLLQQLLCTNLLKGKGPTIYKIHGQSCHLIGSLLPMPGIPLKFAQLQNILDSELVSKLKDMLDEYNVYAKSFMMAKDRYDNYQTENLNLQLLVNKKKDGRIYNLPIKLCCVKYNTLKNSQHPVENQHASYGKRIILPSSFIGSRRYMDQLFFDGMAICSMVGFLDFFLTFTCNPYWPEIQWSISALKLTAEDWPDIVTRDSKLNLEQLMSDLKDRKVLGNVLAYIYMIEFQKRGFPYAYILLFLDVASKYPSPADIDGVISVEMPDSIEQPQLYEYVKKHMMYGPCGHANRKLPCMKDGKCSRYFPKKRQAETVVDQEGYPIYRRCNDGKYIDNNDIALDNIYVVPYNSYLLLKYEAHLNIEWCNQLMSIKYLFKYINKGYDHITATLVPIQNDDGTTEQNVDEIKHYLDGIIFSFQIHKRSPAVERLYFHLPSDNSVIFEDGDDIDALLSKPTIKESMFTSWLQANNISQQAKDLTYLQFITIYIHQQNKMLEATMMLVVVKGPTTYEKICTINGQLYYTFREACFVMGFLAGGMFFLYGYGGTGKTFMWKTLAFALCSKGDIVLIVASSGIASLLLPNDRTAHKKFVIHATKLIIWDEAPMARRYCFEALDKTLNDIMFVVFGGGFRKILPIIPRGSISNIVHAIINALYLWDYCTILKLTKNMCLQSNLTLRNAQEIKSFSQWLIYVGDGKLGKGDDGCYEIEIPPDLLITNFIDPIEAIVNHTYPDIQKKYKDEEFLKFKVILTATNEVVDQINDYILNIIPGEEKEYFSCDSIDMTNVATTKCFESVSPEFLHSLMTSGIPNHKIRLKTRTPVSLIQNLDQVESLCNRTRLIISRMANHVIGARIILAKSVGSLIYIQRISLSLFQSPWPIKMTRIRFPFIVSYAMTINKSQGQSLQCVGLYLPQPVFSHGQLYVAFLRVQSKIGLKILIHDKERKPLNTTTNMVFKEVLQNL
ncbi:hypothetical protein JHK86_025035 [Glycine max]|nr:hypothetical protein JHK86_025035 [Glycine max]